MTEYERVKHTNDAVRKQIVAKFNAGKSIREISNDVEVKYRTVVNIIRVYNKTGRVNSLKKRMIRKKKINGEIKSL
jgi:transposase